MCYNWRFSGTADIYQSLYIINTFVFFRIMIPTFITEAPALESGLWIWAAAAMLAIVLRWFIWFIAMATDAGGKLTGSRGWGIIINGRSRPKRDSVH